MNFDRIAPHYRWLEALTFGTILQTARTHWIETIASPRRVLIVGEGNGRFLSHFLRVHPKARVDCVDSSPRMLELARARLTQGLPHFIDRVRFLCRDIAFWFPTGQYDLLVANFVLDCFARHELEAIILRLSQAAAPGAHLFLADFSIPKRVFFRVHAKLWLAVMYRFFRITPGIGAKELIDPRSELEGKGFTCLARAEWRFGLVTSELWRYDSAS